MREEIPTPEVARYHEHLKEIADEIQPYDPDAPSLLLIGRYMIAAHHVSDQRIGRRNSPYAKKLWLGWVVIGETCLGAAYKPDMITTSKVQVLSSGRPSTLQPCPNGFELKTSIVWEESDHVIGKNVFLQTKDDDKIGTSVEDREFGKFVSGSFQKNLHGNWSTQSKRPVLPDNYEQALK